MALVREEIRAPAAYAEHARGFFVLVLVGLSSSAIRVEHRLLADTWKTEKRIQVSVEISVKEGGRGVKEILEAAARS